MLVKLNTDITAIVIGNGIPFTLDSIPSRRLVTSVSTTLAEFPGMEKETESPGMSCDGESFTGSSGTSASPTSDRHTNVTMRVNDDHMRGRPSVLSFMLLITSSSQMVIKIETVSK